MGKGELCQPETFCDWTDTTRQSDGVTSLGEVEPISAARKVWCSVLAHALCPLAAWAARPAIPLRAPNWRGEAQRYFELLAASRSKPPELQIEVARGLIQLARIQGDPTEANLGQLDRARANLERALRLLAPFAANPAIAADRASARVHLAMMELHGLAREGIAEEHLAQASSLLEAVPVAERDEAWHRARRQWRIGRLEWADVADRPEDIAALVDAFLADRASWPQSLRATNLSQLDDAIAAHFRALGRSYLGLPGALALFQDADRRFDALLAATPNDPKLLHRSAYNAFQAFGEASRTYADDEGGRLIGKAADTVARLRAIEANDDAIVALAINIKEAQAQSLRDRGRYGEAIALQREVIADRRATSDGEEAANRMGDIGFSLMVLRIIARDSGNRALACASWDEALDTLKSTQRSGQIMGFHASFIDGLESRLADCASGSPIDRPIRELAS